MRFTNRGRNVKFSNSFFSLLFATILISGCIAAAADVTNEDKPFAEVSVILQLSDSSSERQSAVLDVANNLIKHYGGPEYVDIEIVAFGPGIRLLFANNENSARISSLVDSGVKFIACMNTVNSLERLRGTKPELNEHAIPVQTGVAYILKRMDDGYRLIRP